MEEFEPSSMLRIGNGGVRARFRDLESGMKEFELGIGNGGVRSQFDAWNRKLRISNQVAILGIGNGGFRAKFEAWNREWRSSSKVRALESEMEEFEQSSDA